MADWFICAVYTIAGTSTSDTVARLAAVLIAVPLVLIVANVASLFYGRYAGLMAGAMFATMQEFYYYASNPEADIYLCLLVTACVAVFARLEFGAHANRVGESGSFVGKRPWMVLAFFALVGGTNLAKGVIFGTVMAGLPIAGFFLWNRSWGQIKRYLWLWGWLVAIGVAIAWPVAVIAKHPEILKLWEEHYLRRLNKGYLAAPWWYYAANAPYVIAPWSLAAFVGLWQTRKAAFASASPERLLWCWAILPPLVFSISDSKHHHYMLHSMAPWAILAVGGLHTLWKFCRERIPQWAHNPWPATIGNSVAAFASAYWWWNRFPEWLGVALLLAVPVLTFTIIRSAFHANPRTAFIGGIAVVATIFTGWTIARNAIGDAYAHDLAFLRKTAEVVPADLKLHVQYDWVGPLETFWVLFHSPRDGTLIRDPWELHEKSGTPVAYFLARRMDMPLYERVGHVEIVLESEKTRFEKQPEFRRVLYRVKFFDTIPPAPADLLKETRRILW
jgi:4-amino-4-deoxy-L-arabinose transferase-like glycosyltransferase